MRRQNRIKRMRQQKRKKWIVPASLLFVLLIVLGLGYVASQENVFAQDEWLDELEEDAGRFFIDDSASDIDDELSFDEVEALEKRVIDEKPIILLPSQKKKLNGIEKQIDDADNMLTVQQSVSEFKDKEFEAETEKEIVKDSVDKEEIDEVYEVLNALKEEKTAFYAREAEMLDLFGEQVTYREEAIEAVDSLFDGEKIKVDTSLAAKKEVKEAVKKVASPEVRKDLESSLAEVSKQMRDGRKFVALTFDDGPVGESTERILKTLKEADMKGTFFMLGRNAEAMPELAKKVADEGHEVANHSFSHPELPRLSAEKVNQQVKEAHKAIEDASGQKPVLFRPPYGAYNDNVLKSLAEVGEKNILWSVDTLDWKSRDSNAILKVVKDYIHPGAIILMHDIHDTTADALPAILEYLEAEDYEATTVSELIELYDLDDEETITDF